MVSVGRALMGEARLYLIDEPSLGLAPKISASVIEALFSLPKDGRAMAVSYTHLDVYKRQGQRCGQNCPGRTGLIRQGFWPEPRF